MSSCKHTYTHTNPRREHTRKEAEILKARVIIKKDAEEIELKDDVIMPILDNVEVPLDAPVVKNDDVLVCESAKVDTWATQMLLDCGC